MTSAKCWAHQCDDEPTTRVRGTNAGGIVTVCDYHAESFTTVGRWEHLESDTATENKENSDR